MRLAYLWVRRWTTQRTSTARDVNADDALSFARDALALGLAACDEVMEALDAQRSRNGARWVTPARLVRARLALAIRAMLRADRGDFGPLVTEYHPIRLGIGRTYHVPFTPLWALAPETRR